MNKDSKAISPVSNAYNDSKFLEKDHSKDSNNNRIFPRKENGILKTPNKNSIFPTLKALVMHSATDTRSNYIVTICKPY